VRARAERFGGLAAMANSAREMLNAAAIEAPDCHTPLPSPGAEKPAVRRMFFVFLAVFQSYATMQNMQFLLKKVMGIGQYGSRARAFTWAVTMLHVGKLISRLAHNVICICWRPLTRVYIAMWCVVLGSMVPAICILMAKSDWIGWVCISYMLIGMGIGVFEATFLAVITPLGKTTKSWAILGIPSGFFLIGVPGMLLMGVGLPAQAIYWYVVVCTLASMVIVYRSAPREEELEFDEGALQPAHGSSLIVSLKAWRGWLPWLVPHLIGKMFVNFGMENLFPVIGFTYNGAKVPLLGPDSDFFIAKDYFQAVMNLFVFFGDTFSRPLVYKITTHRYSSTLLILLAAMLCEVVGFFAMKLAVAWTAWLSLGLAFFGDGLVYAAGSKYIDRYVPPEHHLAAYSVWCFMGDISSVVGSKSQDLVRSWICGDVQSSFECLAK